LDLLGVFPHGRIVMSETVLMQAGVPVEDLTGQTQVVEIYNRARTNALSTGHLQYPDSDHHAMCDFNVEPGGHLGIDRLPLVRVHFVLYM
jgi:hypothetical protein